MSGDTGGWYCHLCACRVACEEGDGEFHCDTCGETFVEAVANEGGEEDLHSFLDAEEPGNAAPAPPERRAAEDHSSLLSSGSALDNLLVLSTLLDRIEAASALADEVRAPVRIPRLLHRNPLRRGQSLLGGGGGGLGGGRGAAGGFEDETFGDYFLGDMGELLNHLFQREAEASGPPPASSATLEALRSGAVDVSADEARCSADAAAAAEAQSVRWARTCEGSEGVEGVGGVEGGAAGEGGAADDQDFMCPVCFEAYEAGQQVTKLPCGHRFHVDCVCRWLTTHNSCPVCRKSVDGEQAAA